MSIVTVGSHVGSVSRTVWHRRILGAGFSGSVPADGAFRSTDSLYPRACGEWLIGAALRRDLRRPFLPSLVAPRAERSKSVAHVHESGFNLVNPGKPAPGPLQVAHPVVQVGECVPEPQVVLLGSLGTQRTRLEQPDCVAQSALVGQCPGSHDAALRDRLRVGIGVSQPVPDIVHLVEPAQRPVAIGEDGQLIDGASQSLVLLKPVPRGRPAAHAVQREAEELLHFSHGCVAGCERTQDSVRISESLCEEVLAGFTQPTSQTLLLVCGHAPNTCGVQLGHVEPDVGALAPPCILRRTLSALGLLALGLLGELRSPALAFRRLGRVRVAAIRSGNRAKHRRPLASHTAPVGPPRRLGGDVIDRPVLRASRSLPALIGSPLGSAPSGSIGSVATTAPARRTSTPPVVPAVITIFALTGAASAIGLAAAAAGGPVAAIARLSPALAALRPAQRAFAWRAPFLCHPSRVGPGREEPPSQTRRGFRVPAATYSPRGIAPKYHRRWQA